MTYTVLVTVVVTVEVPTVAVMKKVGALLITILIPICLLEITLSII